MPFDEPSRPSLLPAQHCRAGAGEAEGPRTLSLSPFCTAAAQGSPPAGTVPSPWPGLPDTALPAPSPARHRPSLAPSLLAVRPSRTLHQGVPRQRGPWLCSGSRVPWPRRAAAAAAAAGDHASPPRVGRMWGCWAVVAQAGLAGAGCPQHGIPLPWPSQRSLGFHLPPWLSRCAPAPRHLPRACRLRPCPSTAIMGRPWPLPPACPLPACPHGCPRRGQEPPGTGERGAGQRLPSCRGPLAQTLLRGAAPGPSLCPRAGLCAAGWGTRALTRALCWAEPGVPAAPAPRRALPPLGDNPFRSPPEPPPLLPLPRGLGAGAVSPFAVLCRTPGLRHELPAAPCQRPPWPATDGAAGRGPQDYFSIITFWCTVIFSCNLISRELPPEPVFNLMDVDITLERLSY